MTCTVLAQTTELALSLLRSYRLDPGPCFRQAGLDSSSVPDPSARVSQSAAQALWQCVADSVDDPDFALRLGGLWHPSHMHALGYAWLASSSLRTALNRLVRYIRVVNEEIRVSLEENDESLVVTVENPARVDPPYWFSVSDMTILLAMCRANCGDDLSPVRVTFPHEQPVSTMEYFRYFRCPVEFGAAECSMELSLEDVDRPLPGSNPMLAQLNDQVMIQYLARLDEEDIIARTKAAIIDLLADGRVSDELVAEALHLSTRTLQRRLSDQGTTFKTVLKDVRQDLAMKYIRDSAITLTELSFRLGFSEMSAFSRAFKSWTGQSPRDYRMAGTE